MIVVEKKIKCEIGRLFNTLNDINKYPNFFEGCSFGKKTNISKNTYDGILNIKFMDNIIELKTKNKVLDNKLIYFDLVDGPFKKLTGSWKFTNIDKKSCKIELSLMYEFNNLILEKLIGPIFNIIANTFIDEFIKEADKRFND